MPDCRFPELVNRRRSVRAFSPDPVERALIEQCLDAARLAPSACNAQPWRFVVADEPPLKSALARAARGPLGTFNAFVDQAPVIVAVVSGRGKLIARAGGAVKDKDYSLMDIGIAVSHFCLAAAELDLGTCILGWFDEPEVKRLLAVPAERRVELLIALGRPRNPSDARRSPRKGMDEMRGYNKY